MKRLTCMAVILVTVYVLGGCGPKFPTPGEVVVPTPIQDNSGEYMSPFTSDGVLAEWIDKGVNARFGAAVGKAVGAAVGREVAEQVVGSIPIIGAFAGAKAGEAAGRKLAIESCGGMEFIRSTSDLSFNNIEDLAVYMYGKYSHREDYDKVRQLTCEIYPKLEKRYSQAIMAARR